MQETSGNEKQCEPFRKIVAKGGYERLDSTLEKLEQVLATVTEEQLPQGPYTQEYINSLVEKALYDFENQ